MRFVNLNVASLDAVKLSAVPLVADARLGLEALTEGLSGHRVDDSYVQAYSEHKDRWNGVVDEAFHLGHQPLPAQTEILGALNELVGPDAVVVQAAGSMPGDLQMLWRAQDPKQYHVEYAFSCMGYEVAGALGVKMAAPEREVYALVGDGSYLMMAQEIVTAVSEGIKLVLVIVQNHGFSSIGSLSESLGSQRFGTYYRYRNTESGLLNGDKLPIDLAANAESLGAEVIRCNGIDEFRAAIERVRRSRTPSPSTSRPTRWRPCRAARAGGTCPCRRSAELDSTQNASKTYEGHKARQRPVPDPPEGPTDERSEPLAVVPGLAKLSLGTAPDSWGVWFPRDDHQVDWEQYLDEVALAGYLCTELGPQGFLPQDPAQLRDELASADLKVCGGTVFAGLHKGKEALDKAKEDFGREAKLLREVGAEYLVHLPEQYTDMHGGAYRVGRDRPGAVEEPGLRDERAGRGTCSRSTASSWCSTRTPTPTSTPRSGSSASSPTPTRAGQPVPGHRARLLLRREQRRDHRAVPGAHHLRPPQAGRPEVRERVRGRSCRSPRQSARGDVRAAVRRARHARRCSRRSPSWTVRSSRSSSRTSTPSSRTYRCRSRRARPATCAPAGSAPSGAGRTDRCS